MSNLRVITIRACAVGMFVVTSVAQAQECQNQLLIDACELGCSATSDTCGFLCGAAITTCEVACDLIFGTCDVGCGACDLGCDVCCVDPIGICNCGNCRSACDDCRSGCSSARNSCDSVCRLDCDNCVFDCMAACPDCKPFKTIGESCIPVIDACASGLVCWPTFFPGQSAFQCFPEEADELFDDETCLSFYSSALHDTALDLGVAMSYGAGDAAAAAVGISTEFGTVYGPDGRYGCYATTCVGLETNVEVNVFASVGFYNSFDDFKGRAVATVESAGIEVVSFVTAQVFNLDAELIGTFDCLALGLSVIPITVGVYNCETIVDTVGSLDADGNIVAIANNPPVAHCVDVTVCADADTSDADADINDGSLDPDRDAFTLSQDPPEPYAVGVHTVTLTVTDFAGESDDCTAQVTVNARDDSCCETDEECDDGLFCNGSETCQDSSCAAGDPLCEEGLDCDEATLTCMEPSACGQGAGCTPQSPAFGLTLLTLLGLRVARRRSSRTGRYTA
ncbi:MAG: hypothetical protein O7D91_19775 [Planctomycetota bacterium]|nr:hypothetical protein [Planctomycetota bacterium]